ncbi:MAG: DUF6259 domain-containing protein [Bacillota bacterium]|nr:DUF6259 domain-containing protein [Bacillota bacterium]
MSDIKIQFHPLSMTLSSQDGHLVNIKNHQMMIAGSSSLWRVRLKSAKSEIVLEPSKQTQFWVHQKDSNTTMLNWDTDQLSVVVTLKSQGGRVCFYIHVICHHPEDAIASVQFPIINCLPISDDGHEDNLLLPWQNGWIIKDPVHNLLKRDQPMPFWLGRGVNQYENEYPAQLSFQFTALYHEQRYGLYFATEDGDARIKTIRYQPSLEHNMIYSVIHYPENMLSTQTYEQPYAVVMAMFQGDWQIPATLYHSWAIRQKWSQKLLSERPLPKQLDHLGFWRINHMNYSLGMRTKEYFDTALVLRDAVAAPLGLHWYGWNMGEHDVNYPEYISTEKREEGWPRCLAIWNQRFDKAGILKIPYVNARLWDIHTKSWQDDNAPEAALINESGQLYIEPWKNNNLRPMCPSTDLWQQKVLAFSVETMQEMGFDGLYLDQIASFNATLCFNAEHPHPLGGGSWWNDSYHKMIERLRAIVGSEKILTTESCCECYLDCFDLFLILDTNMQRSGFNAVAGGDNCESVPLFNMIYGGRALSYGSMCRFSDTIQVFSFNLIRNILWGFMPTIEGGEQSELAAEDSEKYLTVLHQSVQFYLKYKELLWHSRLKHVCTIQCDMIILRFQIRQNGSIYYKNYPGVIAVIREDNLTGKEVWIGYNFLEQPQTVKVMGENTVIAAKSFLVVEK